MPHFLDKNKQVHFIDDVNLAGLLPQDSIQITDAEADEMRKPSLDQLATLIRSERDAKLSATDWTQGRDILVSVSEKWKPYRQSLRDIPLQTGFPQSVEWPKQP